MTSNQLMFIIFAFIIIVFSILTVTTRRILRAAIFLLFVLVSTAGLYFMLNYQFLAAVQLTVYAGGIVVLIIFSILLTSHINQKFETISWDKSLYSAIATIAGAILCITTILNFPFAATSAPEKTVDMKLIGGQLLSTGINGYALPFELISVLLIAAMIASIVIAKKIAKSDKK